MRKWISMMAIACVAGSLAACGSSGEGTANTTAGTQAASAESAAAAAADAKGEAGKQTDGAVTLSLFYWDATFSEEIDQLIDAFSKSEGNENITIEPTQLPWAEYWTKLETTLATGDDAPDIFWMNLAHLVEYLPAGYLLPLEDGVIDLSKYSDTAMELLKGEDEKHYGVPFLLDPNVLIYNKAMFDEAGLEYPDDTWTWEDFRKASAALTKEDGSQYGYCFRTDSGQGSVDEWLTTAGSDMFDYKNSIPLLAEDEAVEAWSFLYEMMYTDKSTPTGAQMTEIQGDTFFQSGQAAMVFGAPPRIVVNAESIGSDKIGVAMIPEGKRRACSFSVCSFAGYANTKYEKQVQQFLKYTASKEGMTILSQAGLTAHMDCFDTYEENVGVDVSAIKDTLEQSELIPILYSIGHNSEFQTAFNSCIGEIYLTTGLDKDGIREIAQKYVDQCIALTK